MVRAKVTKRKNTKIVIPTGEALSAKLKELKAKATALENEHYKTRRELGMLSIMHTNEETTKRALLSQKAAHQEYIKFKLAPSA